MYECAISSVFSLDMLFSEFILSSTLLATKLLAPVEFSWKNPWDSSTENYSYIIPIKRGKLCGKTWRNVGDFARHQVAMVSVF